MAFERLPEDLTSLILAKLPVKTLLRCKCVRKSWYTLINSPQFINLHRSSSYTNASNPFNHCFIVRHCVKKPRHVLSFYSHETLDDLGNDIDIPFSNFNDQILHIRRPLRHWRRSDYWPGEVLLSGSCDGLVCITNNQDGQILICNPSIREFRPLFVPDYHFDSVAFGSDPKTGEHKVVMIGVPNCGNNPHNEREDYCDRTAQVYDFSTDSWRETGVVIPAPFRYSRRAVSLNGAFHWSPCNVDSNILTFHISDEVIGSVPLPDFAVNVFTNKELFVSTNSQLALILNDRLHHDICVMTEYGVKESWTRLFKVRVLISGLVTLPLALWDEQQQLLLQTRGRGQLLSCNRQHQIVRFPIFGEMDVFPYSETLVSVNGIGQ